MEAPHQQFGKNGEALAANYLIKKGFTIVKQNYRYKRNEIDIIAQKTDLLLFVEVKARTGVAFGYPETFVDKKQQHRLQEGAEQYLIDYDWDGAIRFDIIAILKHKGSIQIKHFEDAFY